MGGINIFFKRFHELTVKSAKTADSFSLKADWYDLEKAVRNYIKDEATEEEKDKLSKEYWGYMEGLFMACSGYRWESAQNLIKRYQQYGRTAELEKEIRTFWQQEAEGSEKELMRKNLPSDLLV